MTDIALQPLPEPEGFMETFDTHGCVLKTEDAWGVQGMQDYARYNVERNIERLREESGEFLEQDGPQVTRYSLYYSGNSEWPIGEDPEGDLVDYEEHIKAMKRISDKYEGRISKMEKALREARDTIEEWAYYAQSLGGYVSHTGLQAELGRIDALLSGKCCEC